MNNSPNAGAGSLKPQQLQSTKLLSYCFAKNSCIVLKQTKIPFLTFCAGSPAIPSDVGARQQSLSRLTVLPSIFFIHISVENALNVNILGSGKGEQGAHHIVHVATLPSPCHQQLGLGSALWVLQQQYHLILPLNNIARKFLGRRPCHLSSGDAVLGVAQYTRLSFRLCRLHFRSYGLI